MRDESPSLVRDALDLTGPLLEETAWFALSSDQLARRHLVCEQVITG